MNRTVNIITTLNTEKTKTLCLSVSASLCLHNREDKTKSVEKLKSVEKKLFADTNKNQYSLFNTLLPMYI
jgi:hypothetical protein